MTIAQRDHDTPSSSEDDGEPGVCGGELLPLAVPAVPQRADELPVLGEQPRMRADAVRNRRKVLAAARRLFDCHGVANVSMDAVAQEAGVGKGTLFRRFGDRAGLALAVINEQTVAMQEAMIRGPAPLGPGAPPRERLKAMARAQLTLLDEHRDLMAAGEAGRPGARFRTGPYGFLRMHAGMLIREADPDADWEVLADILLACLATDAFVYWRTVRGHDVERIAAAFDVLVDRLLP
jgi:AcrR family transcriptional regulator